MVAQVKTRNMTTNDGIGKATGMFIKNTTPKEPTRNKLRNDYIVKVKNVKGKKWEPRGVGGVRVSNVHEKDTQKETKKPVHTMAKVEKMKLTTTVNAPEKKKDIKAM